MASLSYTSTFVSCEFDFDTSGKRFGSAQILYSDNENAGRVHLVPIVVIANASGPTVLLAAGHARGRRRGTARAAKARP